MSFQPTSVLQIIQNIPSECSYESLIIGFSQLNFLLKKDHAEFIEALNLWYDNYVYSPGKNLQFPTWNNTYLVETFSKGDPIIKGFYFDPTNREVEKNPFELVEIERRLNLDPPIRIDVMISYEVEAV